MKKLLLIVAVVFAAFTASAQGQGMTFKDGSLADGLKDAAKEKKMLFVDIYTTWCGPCKFMSANIFPSAEVGKVMNGNFVNMKIDAEKGEGVTVAKDYKVTAYPTMLILDSTGKELSRIVGSSRTPADFVTKINNTIEQIKK